MNIRIITASAGTGKTTRLSMLLDEAIAAGTVEPERVLATTFTRQAAAELVERARSRLLESGRGDCAHRLLAARIGTVNSVCGAFVADFAFELGLSPSLRVLDEAAAEIELNRALAAVVPPDLERRLARFSNIFDQDLDRRLDARKIVEAARANGLTSADLRECANRSKQTLDACLGRCEPDPDAIDTALLTAIDTALAAIDLSVDTTKGTAGYVGDLRRWRRDLEGNRLRWGNWANLSKNAPCKKSKPHAAPVQAAATRHLAHPRLRADLHELIELLFEVAARGIDAYQDHKRDRGVIDYVDQETLLLDLLRRADVRDALAGQLDLVLVDEFQDTSPLQLAIFLELATLARESVWVGDPKQAIYGFRGTDPKLMDTAIEALTSETTDPELVRRVVDAIERESAEPREPRRIETLSTSYRSRPELVHLTSDIFAPAFASQGMPEARTRLAPHRPDEPPGLGPVLEYWSLTGKNNATRAACTAAAVADLLERAVPIRDRAGGTRTATAGDLAILCRTNAQCQDVAHALADLAIPAVVPRMGLMDQAEARLVHAGLRLWLDPRDRHAAAELARIVDYPDRGSDLLARLLDPDATPLTADPTIAAILTARDARRDAPLLDILDTVIAATRARHLCAAWGNTDQRRANLDALRAHAEAYTADALANRHAPTLAGFLIYLDEQVDERGWYNRRTDSQALRGDHRAVTISTWHRAKGLEWPIAILYGLETLRAPDCYGVRVTSDTDAFDINAPLANRWIRFWPNPYTNGVQKGPIKAAYEQSPAFTDVVDRTDREALRVLYVGWTRARDRLILACQQSKLMRGLASKLAAIDPTLIHEPDLPDIPGPTTLTWATRSFAAHLHPATERDPIDHPATPGTIIEPRRDPVARIPARQSPSSAAPVPHHITDTIDLGPPISLRDRTINVTHLGDAIHAFLATDHPDTPADRRLTIATRLLTAWQVPTALAPTDLLEMSSRLWTWIASTYPDHHLHRELPVCARTPEGTLITGTADLVLLGPTNFTVIDHKSFPGDAALAVTRAAAYSGQLATYASAIHRSSRLAPAAALVHFPLSGRLVAVDL